MGFTLCRSNKNLLHLPKTFYTMDFSALTLSAGVVALAEMGDKTQLLSLMLAARYPKQALAIIGGIFIATIANQLTYETLDKERA